MTNSIGYKKHSIGYSLAVALLSAICGIALSQERVVVIDAGHGGSYVKGKTDGSQAGYGASSNNAHSASKRYVEKDLTLEYALEVGRAFEASARAKQLGIRCVQTRTTDRSMAAISRAATAVENSAAVFISIHFNASRDRTAHGTKAFVSSETHPDWEYMHFNNPYADRDKAFSARLVEKVAKALQPYGGDPSKAAVHGDRRGDGGYLKDGLRTLGFARMDTHMYKSVMTLLEVEFIDNPRVEAWLLNPKTKDQVRKDCAAAIVEAVCDHIEGYRPPPFPLKAKGR